MGPGFSLCTLKFCRFVNPEALIRSNHFYRLGYVQFTFGSEQWNQIYHVKKQLSATVP
jgi:hypothetical protein